MTDPRLKMLIEIIDKDIKFLSDRIKKQNNTDQFSGDHCAARYLEGIHKQFIVKCLMQGLSTEIDNE